MIIKDQNDRLEMMTLVGRARAIAERNINNNIDNCDLHDMEKQLDEIEIQLRTAWETYPEEHLGEFFVDLR